MPFLNYSVNPLLLFLWMVSYLDSWFDIILHINFSYGQIIDDEIEVDHYYWSMCIAQFFLHTARIQWKYKLKEKGIETERRICTIRLNI